MSAQLGEVVKALQAQQINRSNAPDAKPIEVPQMKSIALPGPAMAPQNPAKGLSIMDIATRTTFGAGR